MRLTEGLLLNRLTDNIDTSSSNFQTLQQQLANGKRIQLASDDPSGSNQAIAIRAILTDIGQYETNANAAKSFMTSADSQLNSVSELVHQARVIAVAAANTGTLNNDAINSYATQVQAIIDQVGRLANGEFDGRKLFAGTMTKSDPYIVGDATHVYHGDDGAISTIVGKGNTTQINVPGDQIFAPIFTALEQLKTDIAAKTPGAVSNNDLPAIDASFTNLSQARATFGTKINDVNDNLSRLQLSQGNYQDQLSSIEDIDIATTYAALQVSQNVYQSSLVTVSKALQYNLTDYLH